MSSFVHHFKAIGEFKLGLQSGNNKFESKLVIFFPCDVRIWQMTLKNSRAPLLCYFKLCVSFNSHLSFQNGVTVQKFGSKSGIFCPRDLEIRWMTLKNNRAPLLCYFKLCASFYSHLSIQNGVTVRKRQIWVKIGDFLSRVPLKFDGWPWKTIGPLFYGTSRFVHNFIAMCQFKKGVTVWKRPIWVKIGDFLSRVTLIFNGWPWKTIEHLFYASSSFVHHFIAICEFKLELQSGNV